MTRLALVGLCVLGLSGFAAAQGAPGMPGLPPDCTEVAGDFTVDGVTADTVTITLTGDIAGTLSGTVTLSSDHTFGFGTLSIVRFEGTITTANGTLDVIGRLMSIDLMPSMPGMPPIPMASADALKLIVTGGTGDTADQVGLIFGIDTDGNLPLPPSFTEGYHGALCPMPQMPAPPAPPAP